jgi:hypothetical protein
VASSCECGYEPSGSINAGNFLSSSGRFSFSGRTLLHGVSMHRGQLKIHFAYIEMRASVEDWAVRTTIRLPGTHSYGYIFTSSYRHCYCRISITPSNFLRITFVK